MSVTNIDCPTLKKWLKNNEAVLIDVRELAEYQESKIDQAHLIPLGEISINSLPDFKNKKLVLHCRSGKRSLTAGAKLLEENPKLEIYNLEGGISAWSAEGCEIETSGKFFLPLDRNSYYLERCSQIS